MKQRIYVNDVAVRDGFQIERDFVPTETKVELIDELSQTGLAKIEVTSFVSPKAVPNMRDAEQVLSLIDRVPGVIYAVLVPNVRGVERAMQCNVDEINLFCSASESHNRANVNRTVAQSVQGFGDIMQALSGSDIKVNCSISTAFGCPFEGEVAPEKIYALVDQFIELGFDGVTIADTTGMANPKRYRTDFAFPQYARHGPGQCIGGLRGRCGELRCIARRPRRLPVRARRLGQYLH